MKVIDELNVPYLNDSYKEDIEQSELDTHTAEKVKF